MELGQLLQDLGINLRVLGVQVAIFVATFVILSRLLFRRVLSFLQAREAEQGEAAARIRRNRAEAARLAAEYEARVAKVEKEAYDRLQGVLKEALEAKAKIVGEAQARARAEVDAARAAIEAEKAAAMARLKDEVSRLARSAAEKILDEPLVS